MQEKGEEERTRTRKEGRLRVRGREKKEEKGYVKRGEGGRGERKIKRRKKN